MRQQTRLEKSGIELPAWQSDTNARLENLTVITVLATNPDSLARPLEMFGWLTATQGVVLQRVNSCKWRWLRRPRARRPGVPPPADALIAHVPHRHGRWQPHHAVREFAVTFSRIGVWVASPSATDRTWRSELGTPRFQEA